MAPRGRQRSVRRTSRPRPDAADRTVGVPLIEVEVSAGSEVNWLREVTRRWPVRGKVEVCRPLIRAPSRLLQVVELSGLASDLEEVERYMVACKLVDEASIVPLGPSRRLVRVVSELPPACGAALECGAVCTACRYLPGRDPDRPDRWSLLLPRTPKVSKMLAALRDAGADGDPRVFRTSPYRPELSLTARQSAAIDTAYRLGFYAFPRRSNLSAIAHQLGISRSATSELLRRAEGKMLDPSLAPA